MKIELIREQWTQYQHLVSSENVAKLLAPPESMLIENIERIVPNIELATDGPVVRSILFFSESYIVEVQLGDGKQDFDVALKNTVGNYRVSLGHHEVIRNAVAIEQAKTKGEPLPDPEKFVYQMGTIQLRHSAINCVTTISYFGNNLKEWIKAVTSAVPIEILKRSSL